MTRTKRVRFGKLVVATFASGMLLAGCAEGTSQEAENAGGAKESAARVGAGILGNQGDGGAPVRGGTLTYASYAPVTSLDPAKTQVTGATGGTELAAIYDLLIRYNAETGSYDPQLAKSLTEDPGNLTWTLTLRENVKFSDGTPLDSAAVVASINRYNDKRGANNEVWTSSVKSAVADGPSNVVFTLNRPWAEFPAMLSFGHGVIVAPSSYAAETFTPVGAGAFTVERFSAPDELVLGARADYWGGAPKLDQVKFVAIQGEQAKIDSLATGGVQMAYLRNAETVEVAKGEFPGYAEFISLSMVGQINNRPGHPGADLRVRQAMNLAIDPDVLDQRSRGGKGMPGGEMFQPWSMWHNDIEPSRLDPARARELLDDAKKDGYDGNITYVGTSDPNGQAAALAVQAMLQSVGFTVNVEYAASTADMVKRLYADHSYDLALGGNGLLDAAPFLRLYSALYSTSANNTVGVANPEMDATLDAIQAAGTAEDKKAALADLQTLFNEQVPIMVWGAGANYVPWSENVYGLMPSLDSIILLDEAWIK
ncbi:ABC transporter substrate-binding protein [Rhodococcus sp. KBS0724]|uniref:ABC transporter substrate-binding protein n=1 Tax=Rhodococcus sp. KBS0724 TaxID=1179674 RepID=UPI00110F043F|nr:ABC transporter substrate-binding protein [Rhodococcus sp. KBS0724]TSD40272.1 ABC transporter substrate-binding protein [Rhodococcus sp. KBS0724]